MQNLKFERKQDLVLYTIARNRKRISVKELESSLKGIMKKKEIYNALRRLHKNYLVKKYKGNREKEDWSILEVGLNPSKSSMKKIKNYLGKYWDARWSGDWE